MFERMKIVETIYERVVEPYYKKSTRADANRPGQSRKMRGKYVFSKIHSKLDK